MNDIKKWIQDGHAVVGIELGSTRIKSVMIGEDNQPIASGSHEWENQLENQIWTYSLDSIWEGLQKSFADLCLQVQQKFALKINKLAGIGISGMMHGYMAFDENQELLVPFRTWRNTITEESSKSLTNLFQYQIPQRWSIAHLYQAILNKEDHVASLDYFTTLAGYIHWKLTGNKVLGVGEASGMFPIDINTGTFDLGMIEAFEHRIADCNFAWKLKNIMPKVLSAGEAAGALSEEGARLLDPSGSLCPGIPMCPPEGDAGTGMVATNSVAQRTGNVSAGTSVFAMVVLEHELSKMHEELDLVTTPDGSLVAMVHCNNCTSELNAWMNLFDEFSKTFGMQIDKNELYTTLFQKALEADQECGGLLAYNYFSGEHITGFNEGRPLLVRKPDAVFSLANLMKVQLYTSLGALKIGLDILQKEEKVEVDRIVGHGGLFKTEGVGQSILAAAMNTPVAVMETAGEGGAWGIALLASYMVYKKEEKLAEFLQDTVFGINSGKTMKPEEREVASFESFMNTYKNGLAIERAAVDYFG
ncbi:MAG: xylulokinase [Lachnospiraceae bacterium]